MAEKLTKKEKEFERLKAAFFEDPSTDPVKGTTVRFGMKPYQALVGIYGDPYADKPRETKTPKKTPKKFEKDESEEKPKKKSKKDKSEEEKPKKKSKKDKSEEEKPKKKSKKDESEEDKSKKEESEDKSEKEDMSEEKKPKKKSKKDKSEESGEEYIKLRKLLKSATVESFHVKEAECHDLLFTFEITLTTDKGQFDATVRIDQKLLDNMIVLFRPEFGNVLRRNLLKSLKNDIEYKEYSSNLVYKF